MEKYRSEGNKRGRAARKREEIESGKKREKGEVNRKGRKEKREAEGTREGARKNETGKEKVDKE